MTADTRTLSIRLREATRSRHLAIEGLDFFQALQDHTLPRQAMVSYLRGLGILHALVETTLARTVGPVYGPWRKDRARLDGLLATLEAAGTLGDPDIPVAIDTAIRSADRILADDQRPAALLGNLYVLEGSRLGGQLLRRHIAAALGLSPARVSYCASDRRTLGKQWHDFKRALDALVIDMDEAQVMCDAARAMFDDIAALAENAFPYDKGALRYRVAAINPEAGRHAMPQSEAEIARALRCADAAWRHFPYLETRYGARGRRFTMSDSCWLLSLYDQDEDSVLRSLTWLRGVLSSRGLPTWILEHHLAVIDEDVQRDDPGRAERASGFRATIAGFRAERDTHLPAPDRQALARRWQDRLPGAVDLLIAARLDTALGIDQAWPQVRDWFLDPQRFSGEWIAQVEEFSRELEAAIRTQDS